MKRTVPKLDGPARSIARSELIGRSTTIVASKDPGLVGQAGTVIDETLHTFVIRRQDGWEMRVGKTESTFEFLGAPGRPPIQLAGAAIEFRPEDRTKKVKGAKRHFVLRARRAQAHAGPAGLEGRAGGRRKSSEPPAGGNPPGGRPYPWPR